VGCLTHVRGRLDGVTHASAGSGRDYDLVVIGTGSGNTIVDESFADWRVAIVEKGVFGGTCLNRGCIPTKMFVYPADLAHAAAHSAPLGVDTSFEGARWREIRDRIFDRIDPISSSGREWRAMGLENVTLVEGHARFLDAHTLHVDGGSGAGDGDTITADQVVIATGSRPVVPDVAGLDDAPYHTSDTVMRIDEVPPRVLLLGGGFVAAEFAHVFSSFGASVTIVNRSSFLLRAEDHEVAQRFTALARERWDVRLDTEITKVERLDGSGTAVRAHLDDGSTVEADLLLVAAGRRANSDDLGLREAGVAVDETGLVVVDDHQRTNVPGIWALGDVSNRFQLKHVSNQEARVIRHNLLHPTDLASTDHVHVPSAVFSHPQVASIGLSEEDARGAGVEYVVGRRDYADTAYGWAMEDETSFAKVLADPRSGLLLGAHLIGPQASNLIQPLVMAMSLGVPAHDVARGQYWIHPAMTEVVENALLALPLTP
jgi:mycothione reductase